jgi:hypothetical protein
MGPGLDGQKDVPTPPSSIVASDFSHHNGDEACMVLEQNDTMLK